MIAKKNKKNKRAPRVLSRVKMCLTFLLMNPHPRSLGHFGGSTNSFVPERKTVALNRAASMAMKIFFFQVVVLDKADLSFADPYFQSSLHASSD
jgi:hypothetical protein